MRRLLIASLCAPLMLQPALSTPLLAQVSDFDGALDAQTPGQLIEALYRMVSFDAGPEPDWEMFRDVFLEGAVLVVAPRGEQPMRVMDVDGFIQDWRDFFADAELETKGFYEDIASLQLTEFGGLAHAFVVFYPRLGTESEASTRGLDSIELSHDGQRWWIAAITTEFEGPGRIIPESFLRDPRG